MKYKIIMCDMDGTLLSPDESVTQENISAIKEYIERGGIFIPTTGRSIQSTRKIATRVGAKHLAMTYQGGLIFDMVSGKVIHSNGMSKDDAKFACRYFAKTNEHINIYFDDNVYMNLNDEYAKDYILHDNVDITFIDGDIQNFIDKTQGTINKMVALVDYGLLEQKVNDAKLNLGDRLEVASSAYNYIEITDKRINKGEGLLFASKYYNVPLTEIMAIGDSMNDRQMISLAGLGVAMGNARQEIKNIADQITLTNKESGVAYAIKKFAYK